MIILVWGRQVLIVHSKDSSFCNVHFQYIKAYLKRSHSFTAWSGLKNNDMLVHLYLLQQFQRKIHNSTMSMTSDTRAERLFTVIKNCSQVHCCKTLILIKNVTNETQLWLWLNTYLSPKLHIGIAMYIYKTRYY